MSQEEFERMAREFWVEAFKESGRSLIGVERMVKTMVGLGYSERVIDHAVPIVQPTTGPIAECRTETNHARVEGTLFCRCGHAHFKFATAAEEAEAGRRGLIDLAALLAQERP